jgi:hypothetical protein
MIRTIVREITISMGSAVASWAFIGAAVFFARRIEGELFFFSAMPILCATVFVFFEARHQLGRLWKK